MIYPKNIIIGFILLLPIAATASHFHAFKSYFLFISLSLIIITIFDIIKGKKIIHSINVSIPPLTRFSIFNEGVLTFILSNNLRKSQIITLKPQFHHTFSLPQDIIAPNDEVKVLELPTEKSSIEWSLFPQKRGDFKVDGCYIVIKSPLGLWHIRKKILFNDSYLRVYPNTQTDIKKLAALFLNRSEMGLHLNRLLGQGKEFEKLREYIHGDSMDIISWKATAKRNRPISKVFQEEQTQEVYAIIDASRLSAKNIDNKDALEYYLSAALVLGLVTEKQKDNFGIIAFDSKVIRFIKSKGGKEHYNSCREAIYSLESNNSSPNYNELFSFIRTNIHKRALLAFMIDLDDPALAESFMKDLHLVRKKHVCIVNSIKSNSVNPLFEGDDINSIDDIYENLSSHIKWAELLVLRNSFYRLGVNFTISEFDAFSTEVISQYLNIKRRQLL